jgi:eukaryotic-like serine/threonine-protein kinase
MLSVVSRVHAGSVTQVAVAGAIDENFKAADLTTRATGALLLDLGRLTRITSFGVRNWITLTRTLPPSVTGLYIVHAPPAFVDQLAMVEGFAGGAQVLSILAPYECPQCGEERLRTVDLRSEMSILGSGAAPAHRCTVCGTALEFADVPEQYFAFFLQRGAPTVDPAVERYLKVASTSVSVRGALPVKIVRGDLTFFRLEDVIDSNLNVRRLAAGIEGRVIYDFGSVSGADPSAGPRLRQMLEQAAARATVFLWRVPEQILTLFAATGLPPRVSVASVYVPCACARCGESRPQLFLVPAILNPRGIPAPCPVCGKPVVPGALPPPLTVVLKSAGLREVAVEEFDALEKEALAQALNTPEKTPTTPTPSGGPPEASGDAKQRIQLLKRIGMGGMAEVFLARSAGLQGFEKYVVVKRILPHLAQSQQFVDMFFAEARAAARLNHPNIVQIYEVGMLDGAPYISMEFVRGADLTTLMRALASGGATLPPPLGARIAADVASALHHAHTHVEPSGARMPIVHRDVSPHNVLVSLDAAIKLTDFGIAKIVGEAGHTEPGSLKGKIAYIAPETAMGRPADARSDVFSLGVVLYELLTMRAPFRRETDAGTLEAILRHEPRPPVEMNPAVSRAMSAVVLRAIAKRPEQRFQTAAEFRDAIEADLASSRVQVTASSVVAFFEKSLGSRLSQLVPTITGAVSASASSDRVAAISKPQPTPSPVRTPTSPENAVQQPRPQPRPGPGEEFLDTLFDSEPPDRRRRGS